MELERNSGRESENAAVTSDSVNSNKNLETAHLLDLLQKYFKSDDFGSEGNVEAIKAAIEGKRDVNVRVELEDPSPDLVYQLPAVLQPQKMTFVIAPTSTFQCAEEEIKHLESLDIGATSINSLGEDDKRRRQIFDWMVPARPRTKLVYITFVQAACPQLQELLEGIAIRDRLAYIVLKEGQMILNQGGENYGPLQSLKNSPILKAKGVLWLTITRSPAPAQQN